MLATLWDIFQCLIYLYLFLSILRTWVMGRASTWWPLRPVMLSAMKREFHRASAVASIVAANMGDIWLLASTVVVRVFALSLIRFSGATDSAIT